MIVVITGPTCTKKSETALFLAEHLNGEIINGDAFQIYQEMNIGVAKPPVSYIKKIPHHLYSFVSPSKSYSIAEYQKDLRAKIDEIISRNHSVIIVGGSGLYLRAALFDYEFKDDVPLDTSIFDALNNEQLHRELEKVDPVEAEKLHPNNRKRVLRALAIYISQGIAKSDIIASQEHKPLYDVRFFALNITREELYQRIDNRVDKMMEDGLFTEVKTLYDKYGPDEQCMQAIGYKELVDVIEGTKELSTAVDEIKKHTRNYAKRQVTFIRHQFNIEYFDDAESLLKELKHE